MLNGVTNYTWTKFDGPYVLFGAGAENFLPGSGPYKGQDYIKLFSNKDYSVSFNNTSLLKSSNSSKTLGLFCTSNLPVWLDRNVYKANLKNSSTILLATNQLLLPYQDLRR
jgi:alkaline phosphatase